MLIEPAAATLNDAYDQIVQIGQATGHAQQADRTVATMKSEIAADVKQAGVSHKDLTYYWELSSNPYYSVTSSTFIGQIVSLFGLKNIADAADKASDGGYPELSEEYIVTATAPDHLPGGQPARRRRAVPGDRRRPAGLVGDPGGQGQRDRRAERRHRLPLGAAPAAARRADRAGCGEGARLVRPPG